MRPVIFAVLLIAMLSGGPVFGADLPVGRFSAGDLDGWSAKKFTGKTPTSYTLAREGGRTVLRADSHRAASGLLKKAGVEPARYPILRWSWKVTRTLPGEDVRSRHGDDFAARVYVVFPRGLLFWKTRAINYVWAGRLAKGAATPSPYTGNVMIVAMESGDELAGRWVNEERNIYEDYRMLFGEEPPEIGAVAVMSDTDDTGDKVTAWYGDITLVER